jgi:HAD superfamily hydrolase (TIGR01509 family)
MTETDRPSVAEPIEAVLFDFHSTLVDQGDAATWLTLAWEYAGRAGDPTTELGADAVSELTAWADRIWERARDVDPDNRRDLDPDSHRSVYDALVEQAPHVDTALADAMYATMLETWIPYDDTIPVLRGLAARGVRTALVSNVGIDVRVVLDRAGLGDLLDEVVLSFEAGVVKPDVDIFAAALDRLDVAPERALMVGDSWRDDSGAAQLGIRTLLLPRTTGPAHGLELVLRLVGDGPNAAGGPVSPLDGDR